MLRKLQSKYTATKQARRIELAAKFKRQLKSIPSSLDIEEWITELERIYAQCQEQNLLPQEPGIQVKEFLDAISNIDQTFTDTWDNVLSRGESNDLDFLKIVQYFRNWRLYRSERSALKRPTAAFPNTLQDNEIGGNKDTKLKQCLCGEQHRFKTCAYLIPEIRPKNWEPDITIKDKIEEKLQNPRTKEIVERYQKEAKEKARNLKESDIESDAGF